MRDNKALADRVWLLFNTWRLSPSQIDRELCLTDGTAKRYIEIRWQEVGAQWAS